MEAGPVWPIGKMGALPGNAWVNADRENASFMRMRNITLAYNLAGNILGSLQRYVRNIKVYVDAQNPFILTKFQGFDPEIYTGGGGASGGPEVNILKPALSLSELILLFK